MSAGESARNALRSPAPFKKENLENAFMAVWFSRSTTAVDLEADRDEVMKAVPRPHPHDVPGSKS